MYVNYKSLLFVEQLSNSYLGASAVLEWRYSFSQPEMCLADNIPEQARASYLAFKGTIKTHINLAVDKDGMYHKIASYALKTTLYFEVESRPNDYWVRENVREEFFWVLYDSLVAKVRARKCPHYWIESLDLFTDMREVDLQFIEEQLQKVQGDPVRYIASEWLEWNRYVRMNCCKSCVDRGYEYRVVENMEKDKSTCCRCFESYTVPISNETKVDGRWFGRNEIEHDPVALEVY